MHSRTSAFRLGAILLSVALGGSYIWFRVAQAREQTATDQPTATTAPSTLPAPSFLPGSKSGSILPGSKSFIVVAPPTTLPSTIDSTIMPQQQNRLLIHSSKSARVDPARHDRAGEVASERVTAMTMPGLLFSSGVSFLFLCLVFWPLEAAYPAKKEQRFFRREWGMDVCFFLGQYLLWSAAVLWLLMRFGAWTGTIVPAGFRSSVASQPWFLAALEVILLSDLFVYWGHRLQHRVGFLWRFHSIHHSAEHLDWLAAHREHPIDTVYTMGLINLPVFVLGFPLETLAGVIAFRGIWAIYIHSNVRLPLPGFLRVLIGAPELHHWHHDRDREAGNYANISPLMDWIFGTYRCPDHEPAHFGIHEPIPRSYLGQMIHPFLPRTRRRRDTSGGALVTERAPSPSTAATVAIPG